MSRDLKDACPELQDIIPKFISACAEAGIKILVYQTYRGEAEQNKAFNEGKSKLRFPHSKHNATIDGKPAARAFDCVPMKGKTCQWQDKSSYNKMGEIAKNFGLEWGGNCFKGFIDQPHFQLRG